MDDRKRTKSELIEELRSLRARVAVPDEPYAEPALVPIPPLPEEIPAYVWTADRDLRLTWARPAGTQIVGLDATPQLGVSVVDMFGATNPEHPSIHAHRAALEGEARNFEVWVAVRGEARLLRAHVEPLRDAGQAILGVVGVALDLTERVRAEADRERLIHELQQAHDRVETLSGLIPICSHCKSVRDDKGYWQHVEAFVREHSGAELSHGICPECAKKLMPAAR